MAVVAPPTSAEVLHEPGSEELMCATAGSPFVHSGPSAGHSGQDRLLHVAGQSGEHLFATHDYCKPGSQCGLEAMLQDAHRLLAAERTEVERLEGRVRDLEATAAIRDVEFKRQMELLRKAEAKAKKEAKLRHQAEGQVLDHRDDIAEQACDHASLEMDLDQVRHERDRLRANLAIKTKDLSLLERKYDEAKKELANNETLARQPSACMGAKDRKIKQLQKQLDAKADMLKSLQRQLTDARTLALKSTDDTPEEEARESLARRLAAVQQTLGFSEEKCWQLEEVIAEKEFAVEEAHSEARRLAASLSEERERGILFATRAAEAEVALAAAAAAGNIGPTCGGGFESCPPCAQGVEDVQNDCGTHHVADTGGGTGEDASSCDVAVLQAQLAATRASLQDAEARAKGSETVAQNKAAELERLKAGMDCVTAEQHNTARIRRKEDTEDDADVIPRAQYEALRDRLWFTTRRCSELYQAQMQYLVEIAHKDRLLRHQDSNEREHAGSHDDHVWRRPACHEVGDSDVGRDNEASPRTGGGSERGGPRTATRWYRGVGVGWGSGKASNESGCACDSSGTPSRRGAESRGTGATGYSTLGWSCSSGGGTGSGWWQHGTAADVGAARWRACLSAYHGNAAADGFTGHWH